MTHQFKFLDKKEALRSGACLWGAAAPKNFTVPDGQSKLGGVLVSGYTSDVGGSFLFKLAVPDAKLRIQHGIILLEQ